MRKSFLDSFLIYFSLLLHNTVCTTLLLTVRTATRRPAGERRQGNNDDIPHARDFPCDA